MKSNRFFLIAALSPAIALAAAAQTPTPPPPPSQTGAVAPPPPPASPVAIATNIACRRCTGMKSGVVSEHRNVSFR